MAVNEVRSMNHDLLLGINDGKYKNLTPNRGGEVDPSSATLRSNVLNLQYNVVETTPLAEAPTAAYNRRN